MIFNLFGGQLRYKTSLSVVSYATMPAVLMALLSIPVILSRPELEMTQLQSGRVLASNLAFLAPEDASPRLVALLGSLADSATQIGNQLGEVQLADLLQLVKTSRGDLSLAAGRDGFEEVPGQEQLAAPMTKLRISSASTTVVMAA